jgi:hypothetical protein
MIIAPDRAPGRLMIPTLSPCIRLLEHFVQDTGSVQVRELV